MGVGPPQDDNAAAKNRFAAKHEQTRIRRVRTCSVYPNCLGNAPTASGPAEPNAPNDVSDFRWPSLGRSRPLFHES
jgi:hypothetical protein